MAPPTVAPENVEATEAWNGPLFDIWKSFQAVVVSNARAHAAAALVDHHPEAGDRALGTGRGGRGTGRCSTAGGASGRSSFRTPGHTATRRSSTTTRS